MRRGNWCRRFWNDKKQKGSAKRPLLLAYVALAAALVAARAAEAASRVLVAGAAVARAVSAAAAAAQQDDDQNDPQASTVITVAPHISFTSLSSLSHTMMEQRKSSLTTKNIFKTDPRIRRTLHE